MQTDDLLEGIQIAGFGEREQAGVGRQPFRRIVHSCRCKCHACACHYPYTLLGGETLREANTHRP